MGTQLAKQGLQRQHEAPRVVLEPERERERAKVKKEKAEMATKLKGLEEDAIRDFFESGGDAGATAGAHHKHRQLLLGGRFD